jgi:protein-S-isoprenylcysteine O-methyltransferase Ste14
MKGEKMSLIPEFEVGLWNAWIFMLLVLLTFPFFIRFANKRVIPSQEEEFKNFSMVNKTLFCSSKYIIFIAALYSIFLPLKLGTIWFYVGIPIALLGLAGLIIVMANWANSPPKGPIKKGFYRYSRHPMYVTYFLVFLGISIATASWLFMLFLLLFTVGTVAFVDFEEKGCLEQYGNAYYEYRERTPRWFGIPKSKVNKNS